MISTRDQPMKELLVKLVAEIEHLRAMQDLLAARVGTGVSLAVAAEAMQTALTDNKPQYDALRKEIEGLA
jgi:hypothetical protein